MSDPQTAPETASGDLSSDLAQAFSGYEETPSTESKGTTAEAAAPSQTASGEQNADPEVGSPLEAPKHWSEADRALFATVPRALQQRWIDREIEQQRGLDKKFQDIAGYRRERERIDELFAPYQRDLELTGMDRMQFLQSLFGAHKFLLDSPQEAMVWLCGQYGVDPVALSQSKQDPREAKFDTELSQLRSQVSRLQSESGAREHGQVLSRVQSFAEEKDPAGNLKHPHFEEVTDDLIAILRAGEKDLEKAYTKAVRMNDSVWEKVQSSNAAAKQKEADAKRQQDVDKAKRAAVGNEGRSPGSASDKSLRDELAEAFSNW